MPSAWNNFVKQFYEEKHKTNPNYKFKQALSDAAPLWNSKNKGSMTAAMPAKKGSRKAARKSKRSTKSKKSSKRARSSVRKSRKH
uniref:Uncharacterized protein n=1 Tax=viral metagenome TaxID=1070528 RepID=A0A6C0F2K8_9ZZZZ